MGSPSIDYNKLPTVCGLTDASCIEDMVAGAFFKALDFVTTGKTGGKITAKQIENLTTNGQLTDKNLKDVGTQFNKAHPRGPFISAVPFAENFKAYLKNKHSTVYKDVFSAEIVAMNNLLDLA